MAPIAIQLSPNAGFDDVLVAMKSIINFPKWWDKKLTAKLEKEFGKIYKNGYLIPINSGRVALYLILKQIGIKPGDEVILQGFTCSVVPNSIKAVGAIPIYVDIDEKYNLRPDLLKKKITSKTKAVIVQHTFGIPAEVIKIKEVAKERNIAVIEDCAHALGVSVEERRVGTFGDYSFFTFGRDKVVSSVFGGMIWCRSKSAYLGLRRKVEDLPQAPLGWSIKQALHPIIFRLFILPTYNLGLGKITVGKTLLFLLQKISLISLPVTLKEKKGLLSEKFIFQFPPVLVNLAVNQLKKLQTLNKHRVAIANYYINHLSPKFILPTKDANAIWLRFPIRHPKARELIVYLKGRGILVGDWYKQVIEPAQNLKSYYYVSGACPQAERYSSQIINLPTYINFSHTAARKLVNILNKWANTQ